MILNEIKGLIQSENYIKADELISLELKNSFDLSNEKDSAKLKSLHELKDQIIINLFNNEIEPVKENFRSSGDQNQNSLRPQFYEEKYLEYLKTVEQLIMPYKMVIEQDSTVDVLLQPNLIPNSDDNIFTSLSEAGFYIDDPSYEGYDQIYLRGYSKNNDVNIKRTVDGLNNILSGLVEDGKEKIIIHFPIKDEDISESALFLTLFSALTSMILFIINIKAQSNNSTQIYWAFDEQNIIDLFKKVITKAKIIKAKPQIIGREINLLVKRALTKNDKFIKQLESVAHIIDEVDVPILIVGETGVGKSFLAKIIHDTSSRGPKFISVNCATITDELVDSELRGIEKDVASGVMRRTGKIHAAEGGTLFFDEIDRASKKFRNTILTFIDTKYYTPVGAKIPIKADVRIIYGSNKDFQKLIAKEKFEDDFLNRIDERIINIPPLRDRPEDIEGIVENILLDLNEKKGVDIGVSSDVISKLSNLALKGNIRDLNKIIKYGFYDSVYQDKFGVISLSQYDDYSFSNTAISSEIYQLMALAKTLMLNYKFLEEKIDTNDGKTFNLIENLIKPIFAHIFLNEVYQKENLKWREQNSTAIAGSSLEGGERATMKKKSKEFQKILEMF